MDRGQPPLFMAYWLWAAVCLYILVADAVAAGPGVPLNFALCMPAALAAVPAAVAGAAASTVEAAVEAAVGHGHIGELGGESHPDLLFTIATPLYRALQPQ